MESFYLSSSLSYPDCYLALATLSIIQVTSCLKQPYKSTELVDANALEMLASSIFEGLVVAGSARGRYEVKHSVCGRVESSAN